MSTEKGMVVGPVGLAHPEKCPLNQRHLMRTNCWTRPPDVERSGCRSDTPGSSSIPSSSSETLSLVAPCFVTFAVPNQFQYPVWGHEPSFPSGRTHDTADRETNIQSGLSRSWNKWSRMEMPYYFSCFVARFFTDQSLV